MKMTIEDKIKYHYMKLLYEKLGFTKFEEYFKVNGVKAKEIIDPDGLKISDYFFLQNNVDLSRLNKEELLYLQQSFSGEIKDISSSTNPNYEEINKFLLEHLSCILFPNTKEKSISLDGNPFHRIPSDAICFYFHYLRYKSDNNIDFSIVYDKLNYIQSELSKEKNLKIAIIPCEEQLDFIRNIRSF